MRNWNIPRSRGDILLTFSVRKTVCAHPEALFFFFFLIDVKCVFLFKKSIETCKYHFTSAKTRLGHQSRDTSNAV